MTPENETETTVKKPRFPWKGTGILFSAFACIVILCVIFYGYYRFIEMHQLQLSQTDALNFEINALKAEIVLLTDDINTTNTRNNEEIQKISASVQQFEKTPNNEAQFAILDADFLVKLANQNLQFENNIPQAIEILKKADEAIKVFNDPKVNNVREALAKDIARLQAVPIVDVTGIYMRLNALNTQLQQLPLLNQLATSKENTVSVVSPNESWWRRGLQNTWQSLSSLVVVRYNASGRTPLISPKSEVFLYENLQANMLHAMWALLHGNQEIYKTSLASTQKYVQEYFVVDSSITASVLKELNDLSAMDIHPVLPDLTDSLAAITALKKGE